MIVLDCSKKCSLNQFLKFFFISASGADIILLIFIAGSNRNGLQTKKCWFAFLGLIIETPTKRPANEFDSTFLHSIQTKNFDFKYDIIIKLCFNHKDDLVVRTPPSESVCRAPGNKQNVAKINDDCLVL